MIIDFHKNVFRICIIMQSMMYAWQIRGQALDLVISNRFSQSFKRILKCFVLPVKFIKEKRKRVLLILKGTDKPKQNVIF